MHVRSKAIAKLVTNKTDPNCHGSVIPKLSEDCFGGTDVYRRLFEEESDELNLPLKVSEFSRRLSRISGDRSSSSFIGRNRILGNWLSLIGLFASYRGDVGDVPIYLKNWDLGVASFERAVSENYIGEEAGPGAIFLVEAGKYQVKRVDYSTVLDDVSLCENEKCFGRYWAYPIETRDCPICRTALEKKKVVLPDAIHAERSRAGYETFPVSSTLSKTLEGSYISIDWLSVDTDIRYGKTKLTGITPAFSRSFMGRRKTLRSEVKLRSEGRTTVDDIIRGEESYELAPMGYEMETNALEFKLDLKQLIKRLDNELLHGIVSFCQGLRKAVAVVSKTGDSNDYGVNWSLTDDSLLVHVFDRRERGNGISMLAYEDAISDDPTIPKILRSTSDCPDCTRFCSRCLLLARTPSEYVEHNLLNKEALRKML
jgi:hypothetical protein